MKNNEQHQQTLDLPAHEDNPTVKKQIDIQIDHVRPRNQDTERRIKLNTFHDAHINEFRKRVEQLGGKSAVNSMLLRSNGYVNNILSGKPDTSLLQPELLWAVRYIQMKIAETGHLPGTDKTIEDMQQELTVKTRELEQLKTKLKTLAGS